LCSTDIFFTDNYPFSFIGCGTTNIGSTYYASPTAPATGDSSGAPQPTSLATGIAFGTATSEATGPEGIIGAITSSTTGNSNKLNKGAIVGGSVGGVLGATALICLTVVGVVFIRRRSPKSKKTTAVEQQGDDSKQAAPEWTGTVGYGSSHQNYFSTEPNERVTSLPTLLEMDTSKD
jgi:hypothetical protein